MHPPPRSSSSRVVLVLVVDTATNKYPIVDVFFFFFRLRLERQSRPPPSLRTRRRPLDFPARACLREPTQRNALANPSLPLASPPPATRTRDRPRESYRPRRDRRPRTMGPTRSRASLAPRADPRRVDCRRTRPLERLSRVFERARRRDATRTGATRDRGSQETSASIERCLVYLKLHVGLFLGGGSPYIRQFLRNSPALRPDCTDFTNRSTSFAVSSVILYRDWRPLRHSGRTRGTRGD